MVDTNLIIGGVEVVGAVAVLVGTFVVEGLSSDPVVWRVLAAFMILAGARRIRNGL